MHWQQTQRGTADLHIHTSASDGYASVQSVMAHVGKRTRLDVVAITDHDVLDASLWAYEHRDEFRFDVIPGVEVTAYDAHVLGLWVTQPIPKRMSLAETVAAIHEQRGLAILAHPFELFVAPRAAWRYYKQPELLLETEIDAIEVYNSGAPTPFGSKLARRLATRLGLPGLGNSDAHTLRGIGCGVTRFNGQTASDLRQAIMSHMIAAAGVWWPLTDYLKVLPGMSRGRSGAALETGLH